MTDAALTPGEWLDLADLATRKAGVPDCDREDAIGAVLEDYSRNPPRSRGEAVGRGAHRAIDFMRQWRGGRSKVGRARRLTLTAADAPGWFDVGDTEPGFEIVEMVDAIDRAGLAPAEMHALALHVAGRGPADVQAAGIRSTEATGQALSMARYKIRRAVC